MKSIIVLAIILSVACAIKVNQYKTVKASDFVTSAVDHGLIEEVNSKASTWTAGVNENFLSKTKYDVKKLLGWKPNGKKLPTKPNSVKINLPTSYDASKAYPKCKTIGTIYNQAECGSCWAFGCVEAVSDRFCISSQGKFNKILSFMDLVACGPDDGCEGGDAGDAWEYVQSSGLPTNSCDPYTIPTCPPQDQPCLNFVNTPACVQECVDNENWNASLHYLSNAYSVGSDQEDIMTEMVSYGPVEACFSVYEDFVNYKSGVYQYQSGDFLGGHCVKCIGYGVENGTPYWLCNNSWTTYWGNKGQFKILRGQDECGIEDDVVAGTPQL